MPDTPQLLEELTNRRPGENPTMETPATAWVSLGKEPVASIHFSFFFLRYAGCFGRPSGSEPSEMRGSTPSPKVADQGEPHEADGE